MKRLFLFMFFVSLGFIVCSKESTEPATTLPVNNNGEYFPPSDSLGGWRILTDADAIKKMTGMNKAKLDETFEFVRGTTDNGGLLVVRHGYLVYEKYFGKGRREATPNLGSCGKSITSIAMGILMFERPDLFRDGLDQKIYTPTFLPSAAFPLSDPRKADIKLGQLLSFTAGIRGLNPGEVNGRRSSLDPIGPDGWYAMVDEYALGLEDGETDGVPFSTKTLWCEPGGGYSYATAAAHIASIIVRHVTGRELEYFIQTRLAVPLGWGRWGFGYKQWPRVTHTPGGGGIALRATDMLRFLYMLLHEGQWDGQQIVPKNYVIAATTASSYNPHSPYGFQFDINTHGESGNLPTDAYWKTGSGGHYLYVVPSLDLIVWKLGGRTGQYSKSDTGLDEPPLSNAIPPIAGSPNYNRSVAEEVLEMVIDSIE